MAAALLAHALAPVLRPWGARGQEEPKEPSAEQGAVQRSSRQGLPDIDYPAPLIVKNTFIDTVTSQPPDAMFKERGARSLPASAIDTGFASQEPAEPAPAAKTRLGRLPEPDCSSSCRSTSVGSFSVRNGIDESPSTLTEGSVRDSQGSSPQCTTGLPDFEYPVPLLVKNTFLHTDIGRPLSLDGFFQERLLHSCPVSGIQEIHDDEEEESQQVRDPACVLNFASQEVLEAEGQWKGSIPTATDVPPAQCQDADGLEAAAGTSEVALGAPDVPTYVPSSVPPPPLDSPVLPSAPPLPVAAPWLCAPAESPVLPAAPVQQSGPVLKLSEMLDEPYALGSPLCPTAGSAQHHLGACRPCAHAHSARGCKNGVGCGFCHLCPPGELKRQQKVKRWAQRQSGVAFVHGGQ